MVRYLIAAHGRMASGIKESLNVLFGSSDQVEVLDAYVDETNVAQELENMIGRVDEADDLVMMSDLAGGSVNQMMVKYLDRKHTYLISGINLALVIGLTAVYTDRIREEDIDQVIRQSREMLVQIRPAGEEEEQDGRLQPEGSRNKILEEEFF